MVGTGGDAEVREFDRAACPWIADNVECGQEVWPAAPGPHCAGQR